MPSYSSRLATTDIGRKIGGLCPFRGGEAGSPSNTMWPGPRSTCMPIFVLIRRTVWPQCRNVTDRQDRQDRTDRQTDRQQTDSIGRTVLQTVAQKLKKQEYYTQHMQTNYCKNNTTEEPNRPVVGWLSLEYSVTSLASVLTSTQSPPTSTRCAI